MADPKAVFEVIQDFDNRYLFEGPLNSMTKLVNFFKKVDSQEKLVWNMRCLRDYLFRKLIRIDECGVRTLTGYGGSASQKDQSHADLFIYKHMLHAHLLGPWLDKLEISSEVKVQIRNALRDHDTYKTKCQSWPHEATTIDLSYQVKWTNADRAAFRFVEAHTYGCTYDGPIKTASK